MRRLFPLYSLLICDLAIAASPNAYDELLRCREIAADRQRLACFDAALAGAPGRRPALTKQAAAADRSREREVPTEAAAANRPPAAVPPRHDVADSMANAAARTAQSEASVRPKSFTGRVAAVDTLARGQHVVTLVDGQVWRESSASRYFPVAAGDEITIRRQFFGGHRLVTASGKGFRVERVE